MSRASEAYDRLTTAMDTLRPECLGIDLFTADDLTPADRTILAGICERCPLRALCADYANIARPTGGFWAGQTHRNYKTKETR